MSQKITDKKYSNQGNTHILSNIPDTAQIILDLGCGAGDNAKILNNKGKIVDGITISDSEAEEAKKYCRSVLIHNLETGLPQQAKGNYDAIICSHVLEHIVYPKKLLDDIRIIMVPGKTSFLIAVPNLLVYKNRLKMLFGKFEYTETGLMDYTHVKWYTFDSLKKLLEESGFIIEKCWAGGGVPFQSYLNFLSQRQRDSITRILLSISKGFFGGELLFKVKTK